MRRCTTAYKAELEYQPDNVMPEKRLLSAMLERAIIDYIRPDYALKKEAEKVKIYRSNEEWDEIVEEYYRSGMSRRTFAHTHGVNISALNGRLRRMKRSDAIAPRATPSDIPAKDWLYADTSINQPFSFAWVCDSLFNDQGRTQKKILKLCEEFRFKFIDCQKSEA